MDYRITIEIAAPVYDVETVDEAIRIVTSKTGEMLNPNLKYVEISMGTRASLSDGGSPPAFIAADEAFIALELEMTAFNVEQEEYASHITRRKVGQRLENIPLKVLLVNHVNRESVETGGEDGTRVETGASDPDETLVNFSNLVDGRRGVGSIVVVVATPQPRLQSLLAYGTHSLSTRQSYGKARCGRPRV